MTDMKYIAILDYHHLDNGMFMKSFAESFSAQKACQAIILHGDSPYTERLLQTGILRNDAVLRSTKDLNNRIIALLADNGVSGIGINGYQRDIITRNSGSITINKEWINNRPRGTHLVLSNLVKDQKNEKIIPVPLNELATILSKELKADAVIYFPDVNKDDLYNSSILEREQRPSETGNTPEYHISESLLPVPENSFLSTLSAFKSLPDIRSLKKFTT